jgi:glycosyltransferase involved in cell wall biosynthesis
MRFAISLLNYRPGKIGGTETYLRQLLTQLPALKGGDDLVLLMGRELAELVPNSPCERVVLDGSDKQLLVERSLEALTPYSSRSAEQALAKAACDATLFPQQSIFPKRTRGPCLLVVHAMQHILQPEQYALADRIFRAAAYTAALRRADRIIAISADMRDTLVSRCHVPAERIAVIRHGCLELATENIRPSCRVDGPFLFYPAATYPYKGHSALLQSFATLHHNGYAGKLVLAGQQTSYWKTLDRDIRRRGLQGVVIHLGLLPFEEMLGLYKAANAVVLPSNYEGFGLPVIEAVAMHKKLITSRLAIFTELGVPAQYQIDFSDAAQLSTALALPGPTQLLTPLWTWKQSMAALMDELRGLSRPPTGTP